MSCTGQRGPGSFDFRLTSVAQKRLCLSSQLFRHENAALFLRLGLPFTLIRHENGALLLRLGLPPTLICHENAASFAVGLPFTLICHENGALLGLNLPFPLIDTTTELFENTLQTGAIWNYTGFSFSCEQKLFENSDFRKRWRNNNHVITLPQFSSNTTLQWPVFVAFLNSSNVACKENTWCVFLWCQSSLLKCCYWGQ